MEVYLYRLKFKGPVHFGDTGIDLENVQEYVSSDTLFSALINVANIYYGSKEAGNLVESFLHEPPFILSSLFVYYGDLYFLPRPIDDSFIPEETKRTKGKELKKLKWLEKEDFLRWKRREIFTDIDNMLERQSYYKGAFIKEIRPRVSLDRNTQQSAIYHCGYIYFKKQAGLYGLVAFYDKSFIERFKIMLNLLGQIGLGGERSYGCGIFDVDFEVPDNIFKEILHKKTESYILLSLYHPAGDEIENLQSNLIAYDILRRRGWITSGREALPIKRKSAGFITEGSVLKNKVKGCLVDLTPDNPIPHRVYRCGLAFTAPLYGE